MNYFKHLLVIFIGIFSIAANATVQISSTAPVVPILKGQEFNQLVRVLIYIPMGEKSISFKNITTSLNAEGMQNVEKIDVFFEDQQPLFVTKNKIATLKPNAKTLTVPFDFVLKPGMHYVWFSATLKASANIDDKIEFRVNQLESKDLVKHKVLEKSPSYLKRLGVVVRKAGEDNINTYRIPGIATTDKGTLISVYDNRYKNSGDLPGNIDVGLNRSTDGGKTWEPMKIIMDMGAPHENNGVGDPAVLFDPVTKKIWVIALWSKGNKSIAGSKPGLTPEETGQLVVVSSDDDGKTWTEPKSITASVKKPKWNLFFNGPGAGIAMQDGKIVFAAQYWDENAMPHSNLIYSADHGLTWKTEDGPKSNTTEAQIIETKPGVLMLNMRDNRGGYRSVATTNDLGKTWVEHHTSYNALQDPVCMAALIKEPFKINGKTTAVTLFGNNNTLAGRYNYTLKASMDLGETWDPKNQLLIDERMSYGYSSITKVDDKTIGVLYEGIKDLYYVRIPITEVVK